MNTSNEEIVIESAVKLTDEQISKIKTSLRSKFKNDLQAVNKINPRLIGGFTIRFKDWYLDSSINNQIGFIKRLLLE